MFSVQCFRVRGGKGLGWESDRSPNATGIVLKSEANGTEFEMTIDGTKLLCSLGGRLAELRRASGVVGRIEGSQLGAWRVCVADASREGKPQMSLIDEGSQIVADVRGSQGDYDASLGREVFAAASSSFGARFWTTGPTALESFAAILHPRRIMYGFTDRQTLFSDKGLVAAVLLYDSVFAPLVPWSGCS